MTKMFSIKDLENLSGIKAHTIRIWEKRYNIFQPSRTDTNIRIYNAESLQKLLNISLLHKHGYKISKISTYPEERIPALVNEIVSDKNTKIHAINAFKMAMMNFDPFLFSTTYNQLLSEKPFREIFTNIFIPLLNEIGILWQTNTITPAHEHFISCLIKQKLTVNIEKLQINKVKNKEHVFVLYLPLNEISELGLMYLNYEILLAGYKSIYLGPNVPIESLKDVKKFHGNIIFVSYMTIHPEKEDINEYLQLAGSGILDDNNTQLWLSGALTAHIDTKNLAPNIKVIYSIAEFVEKL